MGIILYIIFGALVGWIASIIMGRNAEQGAIGNIVVGILGAFIGGWIMQAVGSTGVNGFNLRSFLVALLGAVLLLFIFNMFRRGSRHHTA
jgi:uncharacterized membrane protein YeaQ/YmgE (transglycosylase-associated protein family)